MLRVPTDTPRINAMGGFSKTVSRAPRLAMCSAVCRLLIMQSHLTASSGMEMQRRVQVEL